MAFLGYESHNSMRILGSISVFLMWWLIKLVSLPFISLASSKSKTISKWHQALKRSMFWGALFSTVLEAYIELLIAFNLNLQFPLFDFNGDKVSYIFAMFCSIACFSILMCFIYLACKPFSKL